jgi:8-oxo-dGTP diphosphatase
MQREYPQQPLVGVGAIIVEDGRVLLIKRGKAPLLGEWSIPGGMLEREALEETGLTVRATELLGVFDRIILDEQQRTIYHYVLIDFLCATVSGELRASGDAADAGWFTPNEVAKMSLAEDTAGVIRNALQKAGLGWF